MGKATDDVTAGMGLVIDGAVVPGGAGTYPVTNPARPAEVVFDAPAASATQLDEAVGAGPPGLPGLGGNAPRGSRRLGDRRGGRPAWLRWNGAIWPAC